MGIRYLNKYMKDNCPKSIRGIHMSDLEGKTIVIDISIYMYKYETEGALLENMYTMLSIFYKYNINAIFVFDGKPPEEKRQTMQKRKEDKSIALNKYNELKQLIDNGDADLDEDMIQTMEKLKRQFIQLSKKSVDKVKDLIIAFGSSYYEANGEADELCALLVISKRAWCCLSEDMDMFVYGCNRVLRYLSLLNHTAVLYYTTGILAELNMTHDEFKQICVLSGTDYNTEATTMLRTTIKHFKKYKREDNTNDYVDFYDWLHKTTDYITNMEQLTKTLDMFTINQDVIHSLYVESFPINKKQIETIMNDDNFIFL